MLPTTFQGKILPLFSSLYLYKCIDASVKDFFRVLINIVQSLAVL